MVIQQGGTKVNDLTQKKKKELVIFFNEIYTGWIIGKKQKEVETCSSEMRSLMPDSEPGRTI